MMNHDEVLVHFLSWLIFVKLHHDSMMRIQLVIIRAMRSKTEYHSLRLADAYAVVDNDDDAFLIIVVPSLLLLYVTN